LVPELAISSDLHFRIDTLTEHDEGLEEDRVDSSLETTIGLFD